MITETGRPRLTPVGMVAVFTALMVWLTGALAPAKADAQLSESHVETTQVFATSPLVPGEDLAPSDSYRPGFSITIEDLQPRVITTENKLTITATALSRSRDLTGVSVEIYMQTRPAVTISALRNYLGGDTSPGRHLTTVDIGNLPAGREKKVTIELERDALPFDSDWAWGPFGVTVTAVADNLEAHDQSLVVWDSNYPVSPTQIAVFAPLSEDITVKDGQVKLQSPPTQTMETHAALAAIPGVVAAVPPNLLSPNHPLITSGSKLRSPVVVLPAADADVASLAHLEQPANTLQLAKTSKSAQNIATLPKSFLADNWVLPQLPQLDLETICAWSDQTVLAPSYLPAQDDLNYHPSTWARFNADTGNSTGYEDDRGVNVLVPDDDISSLLNSPSPDAGTELDTQQLLTAVSAVVTRELPNSTRTLTALMKRPDGRYIDDIDQRVKALLDQRWVEPISLRELDFSSQPELTAREPLVAHSQITSGIQGSEMLRLREAVDSTAAVSSAIRSDSALADELHTSLLLATSLKLRLEPDLRQSLITGVSKQTHELSHAVKVEQSAPINLLDAKAKLPVRVRNDLDEDVDLVVQLRPSDPRLQVEDSIPLHVPAKSANTAEIPVNAVGSGNISIQVIVKSPSGMVIDSATELKLRIRAGWETTGTAVLAVLLALLVLVGIVRTVRKGRKMERVENHDKSGSRGRSQ
ncbi:MAG: DUF6049 family protein [Actinomycetaceae bacterium]|nr:DUF6049 family protein [Actinomycetaceae bacterium]